MSHPPHILNEHLSEGLLRQFAAKELIVSPGNSDNRVFTINSGEARICLFAPSREQTLGYLKAGSIFVTHTSTWVEALTECEVCSWPISQIKALFSANPELAVGAMREVGKLLQNAIDMIEDLAFRTVESRLARYLLAEAQQQNSNNIKLIGNTEILASLLGSSRQTLSTILNRLIKSQVIARSGRKQVQIINPGRLQNLANSLSAS